MRAFLLDIEGTTTPVAFVYDVLFPYARRALPGFLAAHESEPEVRAALARLREEHRSERGAAPPWPADGGLPPALGYLRWLMDADRKSTALKALQGLLWQEGFREGALRGRLYPDIAPALARWRRQGRATFIYSSGSVLAQRLIFSKSDAGDLSPLIAGYFDTTTGPKKDAASYRAIAARMTLDPGEVMFVSDSLEEIAAARAAGMRAALCAREGPDRAAPEAIGSFDALAPGE